MKKIFLVILIFLLTMPLSYATMIKIDKQTKQILSCDNGDSILKKDEEHFDFKGKLLQYKDMTINICDYKVIDKNTLKYSPNTNKETVKINLISAKELALDTELAKEAPDVIKALRLFRELEKIKGVGW